MHTVYVNAEIDDGSDIARLMQYLKTAKAGDTSQGALSENVNYLKSPEGGRAKMGEFERYFTEQGKVKERLIRVKALMENAKLGANEAMQLLSLTPEEQQEILPLL